MTIILRWWADGTKINLCFYNFHKECKWLWSTHTYIHTKSHLEESILAKGLKSQTEHKYNDRLQTQGKLTVKCTDKSIGLCKKHAHSTTNKLLCNLQRCMLTTTVSTEEIEKILNKMTQKMKVWSVPWAVTVLQQVKRKKEKVKRKRSLNS